MCIQLPAEDSYEKNAGGVPEMTNDLLLSEKHRYRGFSIIRLGSDSTSPPPELLWQFKLECRK